jgi:ketosteroid isomerase-like protein
MRVQEPGGEPVETWSRGTRVFQKLDGRWQMIHQHVSFPFDPATGGISTRR